MKTSKYASNDFIFFSFSSFGYFFSEAHALADSSAQRQDLERTGDGIDGGFSATMLPVHAHLNHYYIHDEGRQKQSSSAFLTDASYGCGAEIRSSRNAACAP